MRPPLAALVLAVSLLATAGCDSKGAGQAQAAPPAPPPVTVATPLVRRLTEYDEFTGRFEPVQQVEIRARVSGYLQQIELPGRRASSRPGQMLFIIDPRPYEAAARPRQGPDRPGAGPAEAGPARAGPRRPSWSARRPGQGHARPAQRRAARGQSASLAARAGAVRDAAAQPRLHPGQGPVRRPHLEPPRRRRQPGRRPTAADHHRPARPDLPDFDMSEADFLAYQRAAAAGELPSTRDHQTIGRRAQLVDEDDWPHQGTMDFVDNVVDQGERHDPRPGHLPQPRRPDHARPVRPHPHPGLAGARRDPDARLRDRHRPVAQDRADRERGRHGRAQGRPPGPGQPGGLRIIRAGLEADDRVIINGLVRARPGAKVTPQDGKIEPSEPTAAGEPG